VPDVLVVVSVSASARVWYPHQLARALKPEEVPDAARRYARKLARELLEKASADAEGMDLVLHRVGPEHVSTV